MSGQTTRTAVHPRTCGEHTNETSWQSDLRPVHPRTCGEHFSQARISCSSSGSSPHVRGTSVRARCRDVSIAVHPRTCGEHIDLAILAPVHASVHPRTCGEHASMAVVVSQEQRFIPARAGNIPQARGRYCRCCGSSPHVRGTLRNRPTTGACLSVHPRTCGEHASVMYPSVRT